MSRQPEIVREAIARWEATGLIDSALAETLRADVDRESQAGTRRISQYVLASTAATVLLLAAGVFLDWAWPLMDASARAGMLGVVGVLVHIVGSRLEESRRWLPASQLMQTVGLALLLGAFIYSERAWADRSLGGVVVGVLALAVPVVTQPGAMRRGGLMPAVHFAAGLCFLAVFLDRATSLSGEAIVWILDAVLAVAILVLARLLARDPDGEEHPWALNTFVAGMLAGFILIALTAVGPLDLEEDMVWPLDLWWAASAALTVWGIERSPAGERRAWLGQALTYLLALWVLLGFGTTVQVMEGPPEFALLVVGGAGVIGFLYARAREFRQLMTTGAAVFIIALWYWAVERAGALGAVAALGITAAVLFWISGKAGGSELDEAWRDARPEAGEGVG